jgi:choline dehydrogenase-like flavoprotein
MAIVRTSYELAPAYDFIVVGGGSAGSILAARLSDDPARTVLLIEAGDAPETHAETLRADGYKDAFANDAVFWERFTTPQRGLSGRSIYIGSGKVLGGSGNVNGMVYTRGAKADFDEWPAGWRWADLEPTFEEVERTLGVQRKPATPFTSAFIEASVGAGFHEAQSLDSGELCGAIGHERMGSVGGERRAAYTGFLRDALGRDNLDVAVGGQVLRVTFDADRRATGVELRHSGQVRQVSARHEVVLSAGALETPRLLLVSGIGPAAELRRHGVPVVTDSRDVGRNLQDHPNVTVFFQGRRPLDFASPQLYGFHRANPDSALPAGMADTCYVAWPARSALREALLRLLPGLALPPHLRSHAALTQAIRGGVRGLFALGAVRQLVERLWGVVVILGKPRSRGRISITSADPTAPAAVDPSYFAMPEDLETLARGVNLARRIAAGPSLAAWGNTELFPGPLGRNDEALRAWIRGNAMTTFHYAGTCRMGTDADAVVDPSLRVVGTTGLRVADASVIPSTPVSALNAPSMAIGLRAAALIAGAQARRPRRAAGGSR